MKYDPTSPLTIDEMVRALRTVADRIEKHQGLPVREDGLRYEIYIDSRGRLVIRVEGTQSR
jgi:hypothetical protein